MLDWTVIEYFYHKTKSVKRRFMFENDVKKNNETRGLESR